MRVRPQTICTNTLPQWSQWQLSGGCCLGPTQSTTWIWRSQSEIAARIFATHFGHLSIVAAWLSALFFAGGRFSNYEMWLVDPVRVKPAAQIVYGSKVLLQDSVNGETGAGSSAIRITTGIFSTWRAAGITCDRDFINLTSGLLSLSAVSLLLFGGTLSDVFTLNWTGLAGLLTLFGGLNPSTGSLWLSDIAHHHLAVAVVFLVAGHLYRTQFSIGTRWMWLTAS